MLRGCGMRGINIGAWTRATAGALFLACFVFAASGRTASTGLVAAYSFDEGSGSTVADASGNGNNGTVTNGSWTTGVHGDALSFNGSSTIVNVPDSPSLDLSNAMTLEAWVQDTALSQT